MLEPTDKVSFGLMSKLPGCNASVYGVASSFLIFTVDDRRRPDGPLNLSKDNRYLTMLFASRSDGDLNVLAERD